jgi:hypothetical protein
MLFFALAGGAVAEEPAKSEPQKPRPSLNLRLEESTSAAPRINFDQPASQQSKTEREKGLPELGGRSTGIFDRPINPNSSGSPIPKDSNPGL